ncbi:GNAT family protein [Thermoplasma sp.]|uniref:GNAT family N-acetyltransferase n=1 Tax=Thermoplasma sp. TaxID=1973142 RepID=UPI00260A9FC5|nr:GNAT family protein [Thermoplasma sp.]
MRPLIAESDDVKIGLIEKEDLQKIYEIFNNPKGARFLRDPTQVFYREDVEEFYEGLRRNRDRNRIYAILYGKTADFIGTIGLYDIDAKNSYAYIAFGVGQKYWGRGITSKAVSLMMKYAFDTMHLRKLISSVFDPNIASRKVLEKNGFEEVGRYRRHGYVPGYGFADEVLFERFNEKIIYI